QAIAGMHGLRGVAGNLALPAVSAQAGEIEDALRAGQVPDYALIEALRSQLDQVRLLLQPPATQAARDSSVADRSSGAPADQQALPRSTLLLVDDEPMNLQVLRHTLQDEYRLLFAEDGHGALRLVREEQPDLILLD